jgi:hypothetical protein
VPQLRLHRSIILLGSANAPWTIAYNPHYQSAPDRAKYILKNHPDAKIGILFRTTTRPRLPPNFSLGDKAATMIVAEASYELTIRPSTRRSSG